MAISKVNKAMAALFAGKDEAEIRNVLKEAQESIRAKLNLPAEFKLSGLTFGANDTQGINGDCTKVCSKWIPKHGNIPGHWKIFCCDNA